MSDSKVNGKRSPAFKKCAYHFKFDDTKKLKIIKLFVDVVNGRKRKKSRVLYIRPEIH